MHYWAVNDEAADPIILKDQDGFGEEVAGFIQASEAELSSWPYKRAEIFCNSETLQVRQGFSAG